MTITAITNSITINQLLGNYSLTLFEQTKTEIIDVSTIKISDLKTKIIDSNLVLLIINDKNDWLSEEVLSSLKNKPILLQTRYSDKHKNTLLITKTIAQLKNQNCEIWGVYSLLNSDVAFNSDHEITDVGLRLKLIRLINSIMFHDLSIRNNNKFSCGITPPKYYVGDSIGY